jgi:acyl carrier protein
VKPENISSFSSSSTFSGDSGTAELIAPDIVHFDATFRRRGRMRANAEISVKSVSGTGIPATHTAVSAPVVNKAVPAAPPADITVSRPLVNVTSSTENQMPADVKQPEDFLVGFICRQTGYPPEIVDIDEDMMNGLGIDETLKTELFCEIGKQFGVHTNTDTVNQLKTLRSVLEFILENKPDFAGSVSAAVPDSVIQNAASTIQKCSSPASSPDPKEIETFLVNFVVDQTGYPPDFVTLDADFESLNIDSIKKAHRCSVKSVSILMSVPTAN